MPRARGLMLLVAIWPTLSFIEVFSSGMAVESLLLRFFGFPLLESTEDSLAVTGVLLTISSSLHGLTKVSSCLLGDWILLVD